MDNTPNLKLPYIMAAQAQKHVTHNEAIRALDAVVQLTVIDRDLTAAPLSPADGDRYIVAVGAGGDWAGRDQNIAAFQDGTWMFYPPATGWLAWVADEDALVAWDGTAWVQAGGGGVNPVDLVGVNATADATNRLTVSSPATLFNHEGAGHQLKINKATAADTGTVLFQTGFSGRAEMGLAGEDDFSFKVSPDGAAWYVALRIDRASGETHFPAPATFEGPNAGPIWKHYPGGINADAADFWFNCASFNSNQPAATRENVVWTMGYNVHAGGGRVDATEPTLSVHFETFYHQNGTDPNPVMEWHVQSVDKAGGIHRPITGQFPREATAPASVAKLSINVNQFDFGDYDFNQRIHYDFTDPAQNQVVHNQATTYLFNGNNAQNLKQLNAAGNAYKALPYIDNFDRCLLNGVPFYIGGASPDGQYNSIFPIQGAQLNVDSFLARWSWSNVVPGNMWAGHFAGRADGNMLFELQNYGAGHVLLDHYSFNGDAITRWRRNSGGGWTAGLDASDADRWKLSRSTNLGTNDVMTADADKLALSLPAKLASYNVAGAPSAATAGAGAAIYVTDGDAGAACLAVSDGSTWRRVALGATVSVT